MQRAPIAVSKGKKGPVDSWGTSKGAQIKGQHTKPGGKWHRVECKGERGERCKGESGKKRCGGYLSARGGGGGGWPGWATAK